MVKIFRKINEGIHPEIEIGRFLIEHTGYRNVPDLLGSIELVEGEQRSALAVAHRFVENQGDAWTVTGAYLGRFIDDQRVLSAAAAPEESPELASYLQPLRQIARRTGELQSALASRPDIAGLRARSRSAPRTSRPGPNGWSSAASHTFDLLADKRDDLDEADQALADRMLAARADDRRPHPRARCRATDQRGEGPPSRRLPSRPGADRQGRRVHPRLRGRAGPLARRAAAKAPAARDVAGLIRSIDYSTTAALFNATNLTPEERHILKPKLEIWREKAAEEFWSVCRAGHRSGAVAVRSGARRRTCSISSCSKKRFTKSNTN